MSKTIWLLDRSAGDLDDKCGMAFYWSRLYKCKGIATKTVNDNLLTGTEIHDDLANIGEATDPLEEARKLADEILDVIGPDSPTLVKEHAYRRAGWALAFAKWIEPMLRKDWDNVGIESELILDRSPLWVPVQPDRVLKHKTQKVLRYLEFKSTKFANNQWMNSWQKAIQLHVGLKAASEELGEEVNYANILGLMKGEERDGLLRHPYIWGYRNTDTEEWTHDYNKARGMKWILEPIWRYPGGLEKWVDFLGEGIGKSMFPMSQPVMFNEELFESWVTRKKSRMEQVSRTVDLCADNKELRQIIFEQRQQQCTPAFGTPCEFNGACWNKSINSDPLGHGYVERIPHHDVEILLRKEGKLNGVCVESGE
jgi:hypothetical protein